MAEDDQGNVTRIEISRITYNAIIVAVSLIIIALIFAYSISKLTDSQDIVTALTALTTIVGTIIGAFLGIHVGAAGKEDAIAARNQAVEAQKDAQNAANLFAAYTPPQEIPQEVRDKLKSELVK